MSTAREVVVQAIADYYREVAYWPDRYEGVSDAVLAALREHWTTSDEVIARAAMSAWGIADKGAVKEARLVITALFEDEPS